MSNNKFLLFFKDIHKVDVYCRAKDKNYLISIQKTDNYGPTSS